jgi:hypothetical protein
MELAFKGKPRRPRLDNNVTRSRTLAGTPRAYLVAPLPVCEITPAAALVACELFGIWVGNGVTVLFCLGVPVPFWVMLWQEVS